MRRNTHSQTPLQRTLKEPQKVSVLERCPCLAEKRVMLFKSKRRPLLEQNTKEIMEEILESPNYTSSNRRLCEKTVILQTNSTETIIKTQQNRFSAYSRSSTNSHLSTTAIFLADSPYIHSCEQPLYNGHFPLSPRSSLQIKFNCNSFDAKIVGN